MKHLFVPYELAVKLKEKGFDYECIGYWWNKDWLRDTNKKVKEVHHLSLPRNHNQFPSRISSVLYQQVIDWFREKHNLHLYVDTTPSFDKKEGSMYKSVLKVPFRPFKWTTGHYYLGKTYYESVDRAIEEALKLIL